jgi:Swt1-like HEPN
MSKSDLLLRAFAMSGAQLTSEIEGLEKSLEVRLSSKPRKTIARKHEEYASFESNIRGEAALMSQYYEVFYCLEVSIRKLISATLTDSVGVGWWSSGRVAEGIRNEVAAIQRKEVASGITPRSEDPLDFTTFGQLSQLITDNFDLFEPIIYSKSAVSRVLNQLNLLRGSIAHCCLLAPDERDRLELSVRDWFRLLS